MGVIYKLREEVVDFIISQRQSNPLASCRQLAESASQKFDLHLSKSSVHDVLKESGITTARGRKPKDSFEIPQEKKKQIQVSLSQVKLMPDPVEAQEKSVIASEAKQSFEKITPPIAEPNSAPRNDKQEIEISPEYDGAGRIFIKAALWDLGIFSEENNSAIDWKYYLTYSKGVKVTLENNKSFLINLPLPIERCIREVADGLINNVKTFFPEKVSDEESFKECMETQVGRRITNISIVDYSDHILFEFCDIMEIKRNFKAIRRLFVESHEINLKMRSKALFFPQVVGNNGLIDNVLNFRGFDTTNKAENVVNLIVSAIYAENPMLDEAIKRLNDMYIYDEEGRLVRVALVLSPQ